MEHPQPGILIELVVFQSKQSLITNYNRIITLQCHGRLLLSRPIPQNMQRKESIKIPLALFWCVIHTCFDFIFWGNWVIATACAFSGHEPGSMEAKRRCGWSHAEMIPQLVFISCLISGLSCYNDMLQQFVHDVGSLGNIGRKYFNWAGVF